MKVAVSFIKSKYNEIKTIDLINKTEADFLHVDIMDGKFTENKNYTFSNIVKFLKNNHKPLDVHLMTENPSKYIKNYALLNTEYLTFHLEATNNPQRIIDEIHSYGIKCGISIKPSTDISLLNPYLNDIELVLVMSVEPGMGGQKFLESTILKISELKQKQGNFLISVDGGINDETIKLINPDMVVSGSYICMSDDYEKQIKSLKNIQ